MNEYKKAITRQVPQSEPMLGKDMVKNNAGGYVFTTSDSELVERFLILGTEANTYYSTATELTAQACTKIIELLKSNKGYAVIEKAALFSMEGRAPKNSPALFILALGLTYGGVSVKYKVDEFFRAIVRTGSHLLEFTSYMTALRGWGRGVRNIYSDWFNSKNLVDLSYQLAKYQNRKEWSQGDIIKLAHVRPVDDGHSKAFLWAVKGEYDPTLDGTFIQGKLLADKAQSEDEIVNIVKKFNLSWEMVPNAWFSSVKVWRELMKHLPLTALMRHLNRLTSLGILSPNSDETMETYSKLTSDSYIKASRMHPLNIFMALNQYNSGHSNFGELSWRPVATISRALEEMFYKSFKNVVSTNKRYLIGLDVSGSMSMQLPKQNISVAQAAAVMCMSLLKTEPFVEIMAFAREFRKINITSGMSIEEVLKHTANQAFGGTDCALPMIYAMKNKIPVDVFVVFTDNESWAGKIHASKALEMYRTAMKINSKLVVVGMTATQFSVADPDDKNSLNICGFDSALPQIISEFSQV